MSALWTRLGCNPSDGASVHALQGVAQTCRGLLGSANHSRLFSPRRAHLGCIKEIENGKRYVDRNYRLCMKCIDDIQQRLNEDFVAAINTLRLQSTELEVRDRPAYLMQEIREGRTSSRRKSP
jgi:hypothetical protein